MAHPMTVILTDEEYAESAVKAEQSGKPVESVARNLLSQSLGASSATSQPLSSSQFLQ